MPVDREIRAEMDGLKLKIKVAANGWVDWSVQGFLLDIYAFHGRSGVDDVEKAQVEAERHARRMLAAGITGEPQFSVSCCGKTFATRDAADQHEGEHQAAETERMEFVDAADPESGVVAYLRSLGPAKDVTYGATLPDYNSEGRAFLLPGEALTEVERARLAREAAGREMDASETGGELVDEEGQQ